MKKFFNLIMVVMLSLVSTSVNAQEVLSTQDMSQNRREVVRLKTRNWGGKIGFAGGVEYFNETVMPMGSISFEMYFRGNRFILDGTLAKKSGDDHSGVGLTYKRCLGRFNPIKKQHTYIGVGVGYRNTARLSYAAAESEDGSSHIWHYNKSHQGGIEANLSLSSEWRIKKTFIELEVGAFYSPSNGDWRSSEDSYTDGAKPSDKNFLEGQNLPKFNKFGAFASVRISFNLF